MELLKLTDSKESSKNDGNQDWFHFLITPFNFITNLRRPEMPVVTERYKLCKNCVMTV